jgi:hypothetical protein
MWGISQTSTWVSPCRIPDWHSGVRMFGRDLTKQGATLMLLLDQHEHLGQSIAYARSNNVVPPWSK